MSDPLEMRPEARTLSIEELVRRVRAGSVRIPSFQRGLKWQATHVVQLFDSILRGYPIGSLLMWEHPAEATRVDVGPIRLDGPETQSAWWVVDGQQRLTALTAGLSRPLPLPTSPSDPYVIYFDAERGEFRSPESPASQSASWVAAPLLADSARLHRFMLEWSGRANERWVDRVLEAGKRLREYVVPLYIIRTDDAETLRDIFYRTNTSGVRLDWTDVHSALFGSSGRHPTTLSDLADELQTVGMGRPEEDTLLRCLFALRGLDPTRSPGEHIQKNRELVADAASEALPALRRVLSFLRKDAGIPHLRLLPRSTVLAPLTRWAAVHPEPHARSRTLMARWVWRLFVGEPNLDERTLLRRSVEAIGPDEQGSVQGLLALLPREPPFGIDVGVRFDARAARTRLAVLAMAHAGPRDVSTGAPLDPTALLDEHDLEAFVPILSSRSPADARTAPWGRVLHPPIRSSELRDALLADDRHEVRASHLVSEAAAAALARGDDETFLAERQATLQRAAFQSADRYAGWSLRDRDRPSVGYLVEQGEEDESA